jgi:energy-coupling factor transporter ATP-binding protein EcfA2
MDEPTAALSRRESEELYEISRRLRDQGTAIILISHRFEDIYGLADRVTVFRDAQYIGTWDMPVDEHVLVHHMVGREITQLFPKKKTEVGEELLRIENLSRTGYYRDVNLNVRAGEIVGLTGLVGAGRTEVVESVFGITKADSGDVYFQGEKITGIQPIEAMKKGIDESNTIIDTLNAELEEARKALEERTAEQPAEESDIDPADPPAHGSAKVKQRMTGKRSPVDKQQVIRLYRDGHMTYQQIADRVGCSVTTVYSVIRKYNKTAPAPEAEAAEESTEEVSE